MVFGVGPLRANILDVDPIAVAAGKQNDRVGFLRAPDDASQGFHVLGLAQNTQVAVDIKARLAAFVVIEPRGGVDVELFARLEAVLCDDHVLERTAIEAYNLTKVTWMNLFPKSSLLQFSNIILSPTNRA